MNETLYPVDIGTWVSYEAYSDEAQVKEQAENLIPTGLCNGLGEIRFIFTKQISRFHEYLMQASESVRIIDTETVLENEVFYTSKIEGAKTTRVRTTELHNGSPVKKDDEFSERMVKNGFDAVKLLNLYGNEVTADSLSHVWLVLTDGCRDNESLMGDKYRNGAILAGDFEAADWKKIPDLMDKWMEFYNSRRMDDLPFVKASLLHYAFETIHPFCDGNGRLGRLLVNNYLISRSIESARAVSISMEIDKQRLYYDASFTRSENKMNDCTPFISYFMEAMSGAYATALDIQQSAEENRTPDVSLQANKPIHRAAVR